MNALLILIFIISHHCESVVIYIKLKYNAFQDIYCRIETHYNDFSDIYFTIKTIDVWVITG